MAGQFAQFYSYYSFYIFKFIMGQIRHVVYPESKQKLLDSATRLIGRMMPLYVRDFFLFPKFLLKTYNTYWEGSRIPIIEKGKVEEVLSTSNAIVYDLDGSRNRTLW